MKTHTYDFWKQSQEFIYIYKNEKDVGRLIRGQVFTVKSGGNDLKCKITYLKPKGFDIMVNIKVCGVMSHRWSYSKPADVTSDPDYHFRNSRHRNDMIRMNFRDDIRSFFKYFGILAYNVEIGKVKVCKEL